jgi:hypothetical protein
MINRAGSAPLALKWGGNRWEEKIVSDEDACLEGFPVGLWCQCGGRLDIGCNRSDHTFIEPWDIQTYSLSTAGVFASEYSQHA